MKIRQGFVSNSSSSSFIVAMREKYGDKLKVSFEIDLCKLCKYFGEIVSTQEELDTYFKTEHGYETLAEMLEDSYLVDKYNACREELQRGKKIYFGSVSDEGDDPIESFLYGSSLSKLGLDKEITIIQDIGY